MNNKEMKARQGKIRNFSIIAHTDHEKPTSANRILEKINTVNSRKMQDQLFDSVDLERERGITIKLDATELNYIVKGGEIYTFHLIDTPGHIDFTYEASRSLTAYKGAVLVVDTAQRIEAQALASAYLALDNDLEISPAINKIDLPTADPERIRTEIEDVIRVDASEAVLAGAKAEIGIEDILEQIVEYVPAPSDDIRASLKALIFDSIYDSYRGAVLNIRVIDGVARLGDKIQMVSNGKTSDVIEIGVFSPGPVARDYLMVDDMGHITANIKTVQDTRARDTVTSADNPAVEALPGYRKMSPMVYCGSYPTDASRYNDLRGALEKLQLNDAMLRFKPEASRALGFGLCYGFLGLLHMDVVQERLEREFNLELITTAPSVIYHVNKADGATVVVDNPAESPEPVMIESMEESYIRAQIMVPNDYVGAVMELSQHRRGELITMDYLDDYHIDVVYEIPLSEIMLDFFDKLKSSAKGCASLDCEMAGYRTSRLVKMNILLNAEKVDALSFIVHQDFAFERSKAIVEKLEKLILRQQFEVPVQAAIDQKIVTYSDIEALRRDALTECYSGDVSRKRKLLEKQRKREKRMKRIGPVEVPQEASVVVLKMDDQDSVE